MESTNPLDKLMPNGKTLRQMFAEHPASEGLRGATKWARLRQLAGKDVPLMPLPEPGTNLREVVNIKEKSWVDELPPDPELDTAMPNGLTRRQLLKKLEHAPRGLTGEEKWKALRAAAAEAARKRNEAPSDES